ncbi:cathepsin L-like cysteine proteinase [Aphelenchoides avenae]|nr:cathepsin L-like cysteine proteinase [Aphelenchus avenae]
MRTKLRQTHDDWLAYKAKFGKVYADADVDVKRMVEFLNARDLVERHNRAYGEGLVTYKMAINRFADVPREERRLHGFRPNATPKKSRSSISPGPTPCADYDGVPCTLPDSIDWRDGGYVTPVKDQGPCESCWAFSATGAMEGASKRAFGRLISLSEQQLIDCSNSDVFDFGNDGCEGGTMDEAFEYASEYGVEPESAYPFTGYDGQCSITPSKEALVVTDVIDVDPSGDEDQLKWLVGTTGPVSVAIDAEDSLNSYSSGVYYEPNCYNAYGSLNHAVLVVGYGTDPVGGDYWIVKNSWGADWGEDGYFKMARNRNNSCGIATAASTVNVGPVPSQ